MSKLTEKYDKMYNMIEVSVVHKAFRKEAKKVAQVWVDKNLTLNQMLDKAFMLTNSINDAWWNNKDVEAMFPDKACRSTSVGDQVLIDGKKWVCNVSGWKELNGNT